MNAAAWCPCAKCQRLDPLPFEDKRFESGETIYPSLTLCGPPRNRRRPIRLKRLQGQRDLKSTNASLQKIPAPSVFHLDNPYIKIEADFAHQPRFDVTIRGRRLTADGNTKHAVRGLCIVKDGLRRRSVKNSGSVETVDLYEDRAGFFGPAPAHGRENPLDVTSAKISRDPDARFQSH